MSRLHFTDIDGETLQRVSSVHPLPVTDVELATILNAIKDLDGIKKIDERVSVDDMNATDLLKQMLIELKKINIQLNIITDNNILEADLT